MNSANPVNKAFRFSYSGKIFTNNDAINKHWYQNSKLKKKLSMAFIWDIKASGMPYIKTFELTCKANTRHDLDNLAMTCKLFVDCLKKCGRITDDSPKYYKRITIELDETVNRGSIALIVGVL